jgi:hypothetical protein
MKAGIESMDDNIRKDRAPSGGITLQRRQDRATDEMVGICRGLLADGHVSQQEAEFLKDWIERNGEFSGTYPFDRVYHVLSRVLEDGYIDDDESADLHDTLARFVGGEALSPAGQTSSRSTSLPLCIPAPILRFTGQTYVVTGTFGFGSRTDVTSALQQRGAKVASSVSSKINVLVIGELGSRDWINSNGGRKIQQAVALRDGGSGLCIVSEAHWYQSLN